jgi:hypothetical protein
VTRDQLQLRDQGGQERKFHTTGRPLAPGPGPGGVRVSPHRALGAPCLCLAPVYLLVLGELGGGAAGGEGHEPQPLAQGWFWLLARQCKGNQPRVYKNGAKTKMTPLSAVGAFRPLSSDGLGGAGLGWVVWSGLGVWAAPGFGGRWPRPAPGLAPLLLLSAPAAGGRWNKAARVLGSAAHSS